MFLYQSSSFFVFFLNSLFSSFFFLSTDSYKLEDDEIDWKTRDYEKEIGCTYFFCSCQNIEIIKQTVETHDKLRKLITSFFCNQSTAW